MDKIATDSCVTYAKDFIEKSYHFPPLESDISKHDIKPLPIHNILDIKQLLSNHKLIHYHVQESLRPYFCSNCCLATKFSFLQNLFFKNFIMKKLDGRICLRLALALTFLFIILLKNHGFNCLILTLFIIISQKDTLF